MFYRLSPRSYKSNRQPAQSAVVPVAEPLEDRRLFAVSVQPGFTYSSVANIAVGKDATNLVFAPGNRILYAEKAGNVRLIVNGQLRADPVLSLKVDGFAERGLTGLELDPNFATNGLIYVYYARPDPAKPNQPDSNAKNRVSRFKVNLANYKRDFGVAEKVLLDNIDSTTGFHNGGGMHFGPDGKLYVGVGEAGLPKNDGVSPASDLGSLSGKILRINADGSVPADNPFAGQPGKRGEVWAYGLRNPFTFGFSAAGKLYANDVGSAFWEEVNDIRKGQNYGWPKAEGPDGGNPAYVDPVYAYGHNGGESAITGGTFITGSNFPAALRGKYVFTDYLKKWLRVLDPATGKLVTFGGKTDFATGVNSFLDLDIGPDGALYGIAPYTGKIFKLKFNNGGGGNQNPDAEATANKTSGPTPLAVTFSGADSNDPDGDPLSYSWNFGDGTTGTGVTVTHTYAAAGTFSAKLTVSDGKGGSNTSQPIVITPGNNAPVPTIELPAGGATYAGGEQFTYQGSAADAEDGDLPASAFAWKVTLHHEHHVHPFLDLTGRTGTFTIPVDSEVSPDQFYRIELTVTDSKGLSTTVARDIAPRLSTFTVASNVAGVVLNVDGAPKAAGTSITGVVGTRRQLVAPATQVVGGQTYAFAGWSDGGAAVHNVFLPAADTTYTATYEPTDGPAVAVTSLTLINADTEKPTGTLADGATISLAATPHVNLRAETSGEVGSVVFTLNGAKVRTESAAPFTIGGDTGTAYEAWNIGAGTYTLVATAYAGAGGTGAVGGSTTVTFTVTGGSVPATPGLRATYYNNADFTGATVTRVDSKIDFSFGQGSPAAGIGVDTFSARWVGKIKAATTGSYNFYARSDNGVRVWVNNKLVIDDFTPHALRQSTGAVALTAGVKYDIRVDYFENYGSATMQLLWDGPGVAHQVVPGAVLSTT